MREMLSRGKVKGSYITTKLKDGDTVYGFYLKELGRTLIAYELTDGFLCNIEVYPETVCEYTGLSDRSGKRIFEGDIIKYIAKEYYASDWRVSAIVYGDKHNYPAFDIENDNDFDCNALQKIICSGDYAYEIIGNIHDNPELLEEKK